MDCDGRKTEYSRLVCALLEWIRLKIEELNCRELPNSLDGIQRLLLAFKQYRTVEKPPKLVFKFELNYVLCLYLRFGYKIEVENAVAIVNL